MKKIGLCIVFAIFLLSSTVFAAPLTNFEAGESAIDIGTIRPEASVGTLELGKRSNFDFGITTGLNDKIALQYKYQKTDTAYYPLPFYSKIHELNVLYQLNPNTYAFIGAQRVSGGVSVPSFPTIDTKTVAQIGITGSAELSDKLNGWATAAVGNDNYSYEIGVGYALSSEADLNLFYRYKKFNDLKYVLWGSQDVKIKGVGAGITVKF